MYNQSVPVEFCHVSQNYPCYLHVFQYEKSTRPHVISRHWHQNLEIAYRICYSGRMYINGIEKELHDNSVEIINSYDVHEIHKDPGEKMTVIFVSISYDFLKSIIPDYNNYYFVSEKCEKELKRIILEMKAVHDEKENWMYLKMNSLLYELIYVMMESACRKKEAFNRGLMEDEIRKRDALFQYIRKNIRTISSVQQLSQQLGYSREHLSRMVSRLFAVNLRTLLSQIRMEETIRLTESGILPRVAAEQAGYSSYRAFQDAYRKYSSKDAVRWKRKVQ